MAKKGRGLRYQVKEKILDFINYLKDEPCITYKDVDRVINSIMRIFRNNRRKK